MQAGHGRRSERERDEVLRVERCHVGTEGEADQGAADTAEHVDDVRAPRGPPAPVDLRDDPDPGGDDRREADVRPVGERGERARVDGVGEPEEAVHEERRDDVPRERSDHDDATGSDRERREPDDRKPEQRRQPRPVGGDAARQQYPELAVGDRPWARRELPELDLPGPRADRDDARDRGRSTDPESAYGGRRLPGFDRAATG